MCLRLLRGRHHLPQRTERVPFESLLHTCLSLRKGENGEKVGGLSMGGPFWLACQTFFSSSSWNTAIIGTQNIFAGLWATAVWVLGAPPKIPNNIFGNTCVTAPLLFGVHYLRKSFRLPSYVNIWLQSNTPLGGSGACLPTGHPDCRSNHPHDRPRGLGLLPPP